MTNRQRALAVLNYQSYDRLPIVHFGFWRETLQQLDAIQRGGQFGVAAQQCRAVRLLAGLEPPQVLVQQVKMF